MLPLDTGCLGWLNNGFNTENRTFGEFTLRASPFFVGLSAGLLSASAAFAHDIIKKENVFLIDSPWVERAWAEGDFRLGLDIVDTPGASSPNPSTSLVLRLPGVRLNLYDRVEVGFDIPFVLNPDDLVGDVAVADPVKAAAEGLSGVASADFDIPTADVYAKFSLVGDKKAKTQAAVGIDGRIGINNHPERKAFDSLTQLRSPFMTQYELQARPFFAAAFARGQFGPQLSAGLTYAQDQDLPEGLTDAAGNPVPRSDLWVDWAVAIPYYEPFTEMAFVIGADGRHLLSGLSTPLDDRINLNAGFLFGGSGAAEFGFVARVPVFAEDYRNSFETLSVRFVYSYNLAQLSIKKKAEEKKDAQPTTAPATVPATAPAPEPTSGPLPAPTPAPQ